MDMVAWMVPLWTFVNELRRLLNGTSVRCGGVWLDGSSEITWLLETAVCGVAKCSVSLLITSCVLKRVQLKSFSLDLVSHRMNVSTQTVSRTQTTWSRSQLGFGLVANSDLVSEPTRIWPQSQLGFGLGANSDLVLEPTRIWSRNQIRSGSMLI